MLFEALAKLEEALAIIDLHEAALPGIHVANAIQALSTIVESETPDAHSYISEPGSASN